MQTNLSSLDLLFSRHALAGLVADRAASLACRLAGASALTAARHFLRLRFCNRTDHIISPVIFFLYYTTAQQILQVIFFIS